MKSKSFFGFTLSLFFRLFMTDLGCFVLTLFAGAISQNRYVRVGAQIICFVALISIIYSFCYKIGESDAPLAKTGHRNYNPYKGLTAGLIADAPFLLSGIAIIVGKAFGIFENFVGYYKLINAFFAPINNILLTSDLSLVEYSWADTIISVSMLLLVPIISMLSYYLGLEQFSFTEKLFYKKLEK